MKQALVFLSFITSLNIYSQDLRAYLNKASFNSSNGSFLETYLAFDANTLHLEKKNDFFIGKINISVLITDLSRNIVVVNENYILESPKFKFKESNNLFFFDLNRYKLDSGNYNILIRYFDLKHDKLVQEIDQTLVIDDFNIISLSDIQLISEYTTNKSNSSLINSNYDLTPYVSNFYPKHINELTFYFEEYNIDKITNGKYILNTFIETYETNQPLNDFNKLKRKFYQKDSLINYSNLLSFNIKTLPTGNFNLVCQIKDVNNKILSSKKIFFQRSNSFSNFTTKDISAVSILGSFVEEFTNENQIAQFIDFLYPIYTPEENIFAQNQLEKNNLILMQQFFYNFWKSRDPINPQSAWESYFEKVKSVNRDFKNFNIDGYLTDRGRVYLQYGPPNSRHEVRNASSSYPYEIWHYYKLNNQSDRKFVFVNSDFATDEYRLVYSNVNGEVTNQEWSNRIRQSNIPSFGDDFNNNYINPR